jgi:hypothetical protein
VSSNCISDALFDNDAPGPCRPNVDADHFGIILGSPPRVPGGGITGVTPPPTGGADRPGSIPVGGQITPFERDSLSLRSALPVVSPDAAGAVRPRWHSVAGGTAVKGGAGVCDCAGAHGIPPASAANMPPATNKDRMGVPRHDALSIGGTWSRRLLFHPACIASPNCGTWEGRRSPMELLNFANNMVASVLGRDKRQSQ